MSSAKDGYAPRLIARSPPVQTSECSQCKVDGCDRTHCDLRFSRSVVVCMSSKDGEYICPFSKGECPYKNHMDN